MADEKRVRIKMLENDKGSEDGHTVLNFIKGEEYDVTETLAAALVDDRPKATGKPMAEYVKDGVGSRVVAAADALTGKSKDKRPKPDDE